MDSDIRQAEHENNTAEAQRLTCRIGLHKWSVWNKVEMGGVYSQPWCNAGQFATLLVRHCVHKSCSAVDFAKGSYP